jgi:membrane protein
VGRAGGTAVLQDDAGPFGRHADYNKTYGALASVVIFLVWLWITNIVILLGAELNAEIERGRQIEGGHPAEREPYLPRRDEPKT